MKRAILQSGTLHLSPPQPAERGQGIINGLAQNIQAKYQVSLSEAPIEVLLRQQRDDNINTLFIQEEPDLLGWENRATKVQELLIGDVEYEVCISI